MKTRITDIFNIKYPIIQGGMIWASGWELASAVSNAGGLGLLGSGSMSPEVLRDHIRKCKANTKNPFGVNVPIMYENSSQTIEVILEEKVPIVFTSAGNPSIWKNILKKEGIKVVQVVSSTKFAKKAEQAGVDAIVAEGFEAGGHNGREETTTLVLIPSVVEAVNIPVIAAGGIATGKGMYAAMAFHSLFKQKIIDTNEGDTILTMKELAPVRLLKNEFYNKLLDCYKTENITPENIKNFIGKGRPKLGMFEGDLNEGILEVGQVASLIHQIKNVKDVFDEILEEFISTQKRMQFF